MKRILYLLTFLVACVPGAVKAGSYPHEYKTDHFVIHYNADSVPSRKDKSYTPQEKIEPGDIVDGDPDWVYDKDVFGKKVRAVPFYIVDIGKNLEKALAVYVGLGIAQYVRELLGHEIFGKETIIRHVYVCPLGTGTSAIEGETNSITGSVFINQNVPTSTQIPDKAVVLKKACAHELLHNITSYYYNGVLVKLGSLADATSNAWWWESLAPQADRLVWPNEAPYEAELYGMDDQTGIQHIIHDSWDVCNKAPNWYISSAFLSYLMYYRPGTKADFAGIFKAPVNGAWNLLSYVRTSLDDYVKTKLGSKGLGQEYYDYMLWMLEHKYDGLYLKDETAGLPYIQSYIMKKKDVEAKKSYKMDVPYMAMRMLKIARQGDVKEKMFTLKTLNKEGDCSVLVFECSAQGRKLIRELDLYSKKDSMNILVEPGKWTEVGVLSFSTNYASSATVEVTRYPDFDGTYEGKVEFAGTNSKLDAMYTITISTLKFEIKGEEVTCDFEFHKEYKKDGFYAKGVQLKGKIDATGQVKVVGPVRGFSYPKGCINCCDFPRVMDDPKCFKMSHNPYYWKFEGKVVVTTDNKVTCKGFIAAGTGPDRFMKASERLYAFSSERK
jgi:hypothetical protein